MIYLIWYLKIGLISVVMTLIFRGKSLWEETAPKGNSRATKLIYLSEVALLLVLVVGLFWPITVPLLFYKLVIEGRVGQSKVADETPFALAREDLKVSLSLVKIEEAETVSDPLNAAPMIPFGHLNSAWRLFVSNLDADSELWSYSVVWKGRWGIQEHKEGYAAVHDGVIAAFFETVNYRIEPQPAAPRRWCWRRS